MCGGRNCREVCDCDGPCFFGFRIPLVLGYVLCSLWLLFNGITFPAMSFVFWPNPRIMRACWCFGAANLAFGFLSLLNAWLKKRAIFNAVLYGVALAYFLGCVAVAVTVNVDAKANSNLLRDSFKRLFNVSIHPASAFGVLQSVQIMYALYLFVGYIYCGFILQLYEIKNSSRYRLR